MKSLHEKRGDPLTTHPRGAAAARPGAWSAAAPRELKTGPAPGVSPPSRRPLPPNRAAGAPSAPQVTGLRLPAAPGSKAVSSRRRGGWEVWSLPPFLLDCHPRAGPPPAAGAGRGGAAAAPRSQAGGGAALPRPGAGSAAPAPPVALGGAVQRPGAESPPGLQRLRRRSLSTAAMAPALSRLRQAL